MIELSHVYFVGEDLPKGPALRAEAGRGHLDPLPPSRLRRIRPAANLPADPVSPLITQVLRQGGLEVGAYQPRALHRRLGACLRCLRSSSETSAFKALAQSPDLLPAALSAVLIGVSQFFRDSLVFACLREVVLPALLQRCDRARIYSFGCSAGQELYSVAILLDELGGLAGSQLLGEDCRTDAIAQASAGWFALADLEGLSPQRVQRYFRPDGRRAWILPRLRESLRWQVANSGPGPQDDPWDLILFRNVAIYLQAKAAGELWRRLADRLRPGGFLVTGKAERPPTALGLIREGACVYRKPQE